MFSPSTIAAAMSKCIHLIFSIMSVSAIVALEDCKIRVITVPNNRNRSTEMNPFPDHPLINDKTSGVVLRSGMEFFISESPRNRREKPMTNSPIDFILSLLALDRIKPTAIRGTANMEMSALNPKMEIIHAVMVVPMLAPIITPMA